MKQQRHFDTSYATSTEAVQISRMISDLDRLVRLLDCNIVVQEECVGISDQSDVAYPILARTWQCAATISGRPSLRSNSDFQSWITLSWSPNWHKEKTRRRDRRLTLHHPDAQPQIRTTSFD
jgi:hypothetical protein